MSGQAGSDAIGLGRSGLRTRRRGVACREPLRDLESPRVATAAAGEGEGLDRHLAALDAHLERALGAIAQTTRERLSADQLPVLGQQPFRERLGVFFR